VTEPLILISHGFASLLGIVPQLGVLVVPFHIKKLAITFILFSADEACKTKVEELATASLSTSRSGACRSKACACYGYRRSRAASEHRYRFISCASIH
jgi:hypothetical protein